MQNVTPCLNGRKKWGRVEGKNKHRWRIDVLSTSIFFKSRSQQRQHQRQKQQHRAMRRCPGAERVTRVVPVQQAFSPIRVPAPFITGVSWAFCNRRIVVAPAYISQPVPMDVCGRRTPNVIEMMIPIDSEWQRRSFRRRTNRSALFADRLCDGQFGLFS